MAGCWVALAHVAAQASHPQAAAHALRLAIGLTSDPALRQHLMRQGRSWAALASGA